MIRISITFLTSSSRKLLQNSSRSSSRRMIIKIRGLNTWKLGAEISSDFFPRSLRSYESHRKPVKASGCILILQKFKIVTVQHTCESCDPRDVGNSNSFNFSTAGPQKWNLLPRAAEFSKFYLNCTKRHSDVAKRTVIAINKQFKRAEQEKKFHNHAFPLP